MKPAHTLAALGATLLFCLPALAQEEAPAFDLVERMNAHLRAIQPEGGNAWFLYRRILEEGIGADLDADPNPDGPMWAFERADFYLLRRGRWDDPRLDASRAGLERWAHLLPMLEGALALPGYARWYERDEEVGLRGGPLVDINARLRVLAQFNAGAMRAAAEAGDWSAFTLRLRVGLAMARHQSFQPTQVGQLVATAILDNHLDEVRDQLNERPIDAASARAVLEVLGERPWRAGVGLVPAIESGLAFRGHDGEAFEFLFGVEPWSEAEIASAAERLRVHAERMLLMHPLTLRQYARSIDQGDAEALFDPKTAPEAMAQMIYTSIRNTHMITSELAATRLMLLLEIHHAQTGAWPDSLDEVGQPSDRVDPALGLPFRYRPTPDAPHGFPYELRLPAQAPDDWLRRPDGDGWLNPPREGLPGE